SHRGIENNRHRRKEFHRPAHLSAEAPRKNSYCSKTCSFRKAAPFGAWTAWLPSRAHRTREKNPGRASSWKTGQSGKYEFDQTEADGRPKRSLVAAAPSAIKSDGRRCLVLPSG